MTDDTTTNAERIVDRMGSQLGDNLNNVFGDISTADVFQTLETSDDRVVLGASTIERAGGFGFGAGEGVDQASGNGAGGGGGGGWGQARPVAIIEVTAQGVKVWPVLDYTKLGLVAVGVLAAIWKARR